LAEHRKFFSSFLWKSFTDPETKVYPAALSEDLVILALAVSDWSIRVTDRQTNRQTDGIAKAKTRCSSIALAASVARKKK